MEGGTQNILHAQENIGGKVDNDVSAFTTNVIRFPGILHVMRSFASNALVRLKIRPCRQSVNYRRERIEREMAERYGNSYLEFPQGADGLFPHNQVSRKEIVLGENTTNTCNIALADVDGDGLDEIATPLTLEEDDCVRLYRGNGDLLWNNTDIRLYHAYYNDPDCPPGGIAHLWHRSKHRHVLTEIADIDGDGKPEVIVGDGPVYILDGLTGCIKAVLDLGGRIALWNVVADPARGMSLLICAVDDRKRGPRVTAVDASGDEFWSIPTPGRIFCDCMHHGDLDRDGRPEIGFSVEEEETFWVIDCDGAILWKKHIPSELGDDPHIDDFLIDQILPEDRRAGRQLLLVTGPNLLDCNGNILWSGQDRYHHPQKVLAANLREDFPGKEVYTVESFKRCAHLLTCDGDPIWAYDNFTRTRKPYESATPGFEQSIGRLTTAGSLVDWYGNGRTLIAQTEMGYLPSVEEQKRNHPIPPDAMVWFLHLLDGEGRPAVIFPLDDSPMCACACRVTDTPGEDLVVVGHRNSKISIYSAEPVDS